MSQTIDSLDNLQLRAINGEISLSRRNQQRLFDRQLSSIVYVGTQEGNQEVYDLQKADGTIQHRLTLCPLARRTSRGTRWRGTIQLSTMAA